METRKHVIPGMPIESSDGTTIGTVKEVAEGAFKVDAPLRPDYWLPCDLVGSHTATALQLRLDRAALKDHRLKDTDRARQPATMDVLRREQTLAAVANRAMRRYRAGVQEEHERRERRDRALRVAAIAAGLIAAAGGAIAGYRRASAH